jgi:hypothetical protein
MTVSVPTGKPLYETLSPVVLQSTFKSTANALQSTFSKGDMVNRTGEMQEKVDQFFYDFQPLITTQVSSANTYNILASMCGRKVVKFSPVQASPEAKKLVEGLDASQIHEMLNAGETPAAAVQTAAVITPPTVALNESSLAHTQTFWEWAVEKVVEAGTVVRDGAVTGGTVVYNGVSTGASTVYNGAADSAAWMQSFVTWTPAQQQDVRAALQERLADLEEKKS